MTDHVKQLHERQLLLTAFLETHEALLEAFREALCEGNTPVNLRLVIANAVAEDGRPLQLVLEMNLQQDDFWKSFDDIQMSYE